MLFRTVNIRSIGILIVINILIYGILLRWFSPTNSSSSRDDNIVYSSFIPGNKQALSPPSIFKDAPMHNELIELQFRPVR
jgi:hypothetical protein